MALSYNNLYKTGFAGQSIGGMGCTAFAPLTVGQHDPSRCRHYANHLIGNAKLRTHDVSSPRRRSGHMNTLLGCMNSEA